MKRILLVGLLIALAAIGISAQNLPSITIVNNTGYDIYHIEISPSTDDEWSDEDLLEEETLKNGASKTFRLNYPLNSVYVYDIRLIDENVIWYIKWEVAITNNARIVFTEDDYWDENTYNPH